MRLPPSDLVFPNQLSISGGIKVLMRFLNPLETYLDNLRQTTLQVTYYMEYEHIYVLIVLATP